MREVKISEFLNKWSLLWIYDYNTTTISSEDKTIDWPTVWSIQFTIVWILENQSIVWFSSLLVQF